MKKVLTMIGLCAGTLFLLLYPPLLSVWRDGIVSAFSFFAYDAFYYLSIAKNSVFGHFTFDGITPTNGFHPLWQWILTLLVKVSSNTDLQINLTHYLGIATVACAYLLLAVAAYSYTRSSLLALLVVPGFYTLLLGDSVGSPWTYMNGMESPLSLFFGSLLIWVVHRCAVKSQRPTAYFGLVGFVLPFILLSRLDDGFLIPCFFVQALLWNGSAAEKLRRSLLVIAPSLVVLIAYLSFNYSYSAMLLPVSGVAKSGFALWGNLVDMGCNLLALKGRGWDDYRHAQLVYPALSAGALLVFMRVFRSDSGKLNAYAPILAYVLVKAVYNLVVVKFADQGTWYYPLSIVSVNVIAVMFLYEWMTAARWPAVARTCLVLPLLYVGLIHMADFTKVRSGAHGDYYLAYRDRAALRSQLEARTPHPQLLEMDDGILNYSLGLPTISGLGLMADKSALEAQRCSRSLLKYAYDRSFRVLGSVYYFGPHRRDHRLITQGTTSEEIARVLTWWYPDADDYSYEVILMDTNSGATFIQFREKPMDARTTVQPAATVAREPDGGSL